MATVEKVKSNLILKVSTEQINLSSAKNDPRALSSTIVTEVGLAKFRAGFMSVENTLERLEECPQSERIPQGVGKSFKADKLIRDKRTYRRYAVVIYVAPTNAILQERLMTAVPANIRTYRFEPRPRSRCGDLDQEWTQHERLGRSAFAKQTICRRCPRLRRCRWPINFKDKIRDAKLILCTEQQIINDPTFILK